jgi:hypothetical protein
VLGLGSWLHQIRREVQGAHEWAEAAITLSTADDSSYDEILRELALARMIERGLEDSQAHRTISDEEMRQRIRTWQK